MSEISVEAFGSAVGAYTLIPDGSTVGMYGIQHNRSRCSNNYFTSFWRSARITQCPSVPDFCGSRAIKLGETNFLSICNNYNYLHILFIPHFHPFDSICQPFAIRGDCASKIVDLALASALKPKLKKATAASPNVPPWISP